PSSSPVPFLIARWMFSEGMFASLAASMAARRRGFPAGSPPPRRAATVSSLMILLKSLPLVASIASFLFLIFCHRLWSDMTDLRSAPRSGQLRSALEQGARLRGELPVRLHRQVAPERRLGFLGLAQPVVDGGQQQQRAPVVRVQRQRLGGGVPGALQV